MSVAEEQNPDLVLGKHSLAKGELKSMCWILLFWNELVIGLL